MKRILTVLALVGVLAAIVAISVGFQRDYLALDPKVRRVNKLFRYHDREVQPGIGVLAIKDGSVVLNETWGMANLENRVPLTPASVMDMGSMSKQFTAFAVATLVSQGKISLDDSVREYIPELPAWGDEVKLSHLVFHTSGIRDWVGTLTISGWTQEDVMTQEHINQMAFDQEELVNPPGGRYDYSNTGWNLMGLVIERVTGQSLRAWLEENLFRPLGMNASLVRDDHTEIIPNRAVGYKRGRQGFYRVTDNLMGVGSSSIRTTMEDLARWYQNFDTHAVGGDEVFDVMLNSKSVLNDGLVHFKRIAFDEGTYRGLPALTHAGIWAGFRHQFLLFPEDNMYFVVVSNYDGTRANCRVRQVADLFLDDILPEEDGDDEEGDDEARRELESLPPEKLAEYEGFYRLRRARYAHVWRDGDSLLAEETGEDPVAFLPWREDLFVARDSVHYLVFRRNDEGEVHRLLAGAVNRNPCPAKGDFDYDIERPEGWTSSPPGSNRREYIPHPTVEELREFEGVYVSPELSTSYAVALEDEGLVLRHKRHGTLPIIHAYRDEFKGTEWYTRAVDFRRNDAGEITGMVIDLGSRTRNLVFRRVDPASQAYVPG